MKNFKDLQKELKESESKIKNIEFTSVELLKSIFDITNSNIFDKTDITKMLFLYPLTAINEVKNEVIATLIYANIL